MEYKFFEYFKDLCKIPHGSGNTKSISDYCVEFAKSKSLKYIQDTLNNVIIFKDGSKGKENLPPVIIQGHLDMVCEKASDCNKDMTREAIDLVAGEEYYYAKGTSLGGDDGIAVAYALALLDDDSIEHPPLEVVFTIDEETGMDGAKGIDLSVLKGKRLLNVDCETEGVFIVGCAGGLRNQIELPVEWESVTDDLFTIEFSGLLGGHSGGCINMGLANAVKISCEFLNKLSKSVDFRIAEYNGGDKDNAIPSHVVMKLTMDSSDEKFLMKTAEDFVAKHKKSYPNDPDLKIDIKKISPKRVEALSDESTLRVIALIDALPNGVQKMSALKGLVQTSLNLGSVRLKNDKLVLRFALRSSVGEEKTALSDKLKYIAKMYGASSETSGEYPAWSYEAESPLRKLMCEAFEKQYGKAPSVEIMHAGIECGYFSEKIPGLDCVSFGPTVEDIHTFKERLSVPSAIRTWNLILGILKRMCE